MQRSQSAPDVATQHRDRPHVPRRTKTSTNLAAEPARPSPVQRQEPEDPFNLGGFFPAHLRTDDDQEWRWLRYGEGAGEGEGEERRLAVVAEEAPSRQSLFSQKGSASTGAAIRREDKFGILSILDSLALEPETPPADDRLLSPYTEDTACDEEALRQAYGARRAAWCEVSSGGAGAGIGSLFVGDEDEDEDGVGASVWGRL